MTRNRALAAALASLLAACGGRVSLDDASPCADGTSLDGAQCLPTDAGADATLACGPASFPCPPDRDAGDLLDAGAPFPRDTGPSDAGAATQDAPVASDASDSGDDAATRFPLDPTPCLHGGNIIYFDGDPDDPVYAGKIAYTSATGPFQAFGYGTYTDALDDINIEIVPPNVALAIDAELIAVGQIYEGYRLGDIPWIFTITPTTRCRSAAGRMRVDDLAFHLVDSGAAPPIDRLTVSFARTCEGSTAVMRGCAHFGP